MLCICVSRSFRRFLFVLAALTLVAGCASEPKTTEDAWSTGGEQMADEVDVDRDPLEVPNRLIFSFNLALDTLIFRPAAATYGFLLPVEVRDSVRNALRNLRTPVVLANDLFQGEWERAETTLVRFIINSTVGILGLFDVAADWGYEYHDEDFGQTLGSHGVGEIVYIVLPIFGPSSARDGTGRLVDTFLDPLTYLLETEPLLARTAVTGIDERERNIDTLDDLKRDSIDFYARIRSLYRQTRSNAIANGETAPSDMPTPGLYSFEFETDDDDESKADVSQ